MTVSSFSLILETPPGETCDTGCGDSDRLSEKVAVELIDRLRFVVVNEDCALTLPVELLRNNDPLFTTLQAGMLLSESSDTVSTQSPRELSVCIAC